MTLDDIPSWRLGRIAGVPVHVDLTFAVMPVLLLPFQRLIAVLTGDAPEAAGRLLLIWSIEVVGTFASILLHEIGHAAAAHNFGARAYRIVVGGFYGFALLPNTSATRRSAIPILAAGPLVNLLLAAALWLLLGAPAVDQRLRLDYGGYAQWPFWRTAVVWLFYLNVAIALFNMLPAFPLDGGRIARIVLRRWLTEDKAIRFIAATGIFVAAWSCLGAAGYGLTLVTVGLFLLVTNVAIWRGEIDPPFD